MKEPIYLDNQATTAVDPRVLAAMLPYFSEEYGNAASTEHRYGWTAEAAVKLARERIAAAIGAMRTSEILFTSGATESNNLALLGVARAYASRGRHLITVETEHSSVLDTCSAWEREGGEVSYLHVDGEGLVQPERLRELLRDDTVMVSIMAANNEIGVLQPVAALSKIAHERGALFHCDGAQAVGKIPINVEEQGVDLLSFTAHKFYGPKGVGALYVRGSQPRVRLMPLLHGGGHEGGRRSGTLNVPGIVGMAEALVLCQQEMEVEQARLVAMREHFWQQIQARTAEVRLNGHPRLRLPGNLSLSFADLDGTKLLLALPELALSSRSACSSAKLKPSHVLAALGLDPRWTQAVLRVGFGRFNTFEEAERAAHLISQAVARLCAA